MWPFTRKESKKEEKKNWKFEAIAELGSFRKIGEKFKYLGVEMIVTAYYEEHYTGGEFPRYWVTPCIKADYVDANGVIHNIIFDYSELKTLKNENNA